MTEKKVTDELLATAQPDLFFKNNTVVRLKDEIWQADDVWIEAILAEYGIPSPAKWGKSVSYIQTTVRHQAGGRP